GFITVDRASAVYGVVVTPDMTVDEEATLRRREELARLRVHLTLAKLPEADAFGGIRGRHRRVEVSPETAGRLGMEQGSLIELWGSHPAPLRAWVYFGEQPADCIALSPSGCAILGTEVGQEVMMRVLSTRFKV